MTKFEIILCKLQSEIVCTTLDGMFWNLLPKIIVMYKFLLFCACANVEMIYFENDNGPKVLHTHDEYYEY